MVELYSGFFSMLRLAKNLYDNGLAERTPRLFQGLTLNEDSFYELRPRILGTVSRLFVKHCNRG